MPNVPLECRCRKPGWFLGVGLGAVLLLGPWSSRAEVYYVDGPGATDAQRIATSMLNDALSGRSRQMDFRLPPNPFTQRIEEYQNRQRAREAEMAWYAAHAQEILVERRWVERMEAAERDRVQRQQREWERFDALKKQAEDLNPEAHLQLGTIVDSGKYDASVVQFSKDKTPREYALERYSQAFGLGMDLAVVALACGSLDLKPGFPALRETLEGLKRPMEQRLYLERLAQNGHVGAQLWLGGWAVGRRVGLGSSLPLPDGETARSYALRWLSMANPETIGVWYAQTLLNGRPTDAEKSRAVQILRNIAVETNAGRADAFMALGQHWIAEAVTSSELDRARAQLRVFERVDYLPGVRALVEMYYGGTDGEFHPGRAAAVYARIPDRPYLVLYRTRALTLEAVDLLFGVDGKRSPSEALSKLEEADLVLDKAGGSPSSLAQHRQSILLWRAYALAEAGRTRLLVPDPVAALMKANEDYGGIAKLLWRHAFLGIPTNSVIAVRGAWGMVRFDETLNRSLSPVEILLFLQSALRAHERGALPALAPYAQEIRGLNPVEAPTRGAALLTQLLLTPVFDRDVNQREALVAAYGTLVRCAWQLPEIWSDVAALVEVLQTEPLTPAQWKEGWLKPFLDARALESSAQRRWGEWLLDPRADRWNQLMGGGGLHLTPKAGVRPELQALHASVLLRSTTNIASAATAFDALVKLADSGQFHAQALIETFTERYRLSYAQRSDLEGFRSHARLAAERTAAWRKTGFGASHRDKDLYFKAVGQALEFGSTRFNRSELEEGAGYSTAASMALLRLKALETDSRTQAEREDDQLLEARWIRFCERKGFPVDQGSTVYRLGLIGTDIAEERGPEAAIAMLQRQARRYPVLWWTIAQSFALGTTYFPVDDARALEAYRTASSSPAKPRFADLIRWAKVVAAHGSPDDFKRLESVVSRDEFGLQRWRNPNEKGYSIALEPPLETADTIAAAVLKRGIDTPSDPDVRDIERARRWQLFALGLGSSEALGRLRRVPFSTLPDTGELLATALIDVSTVNVPLALEVATNDVPEGPRQAALLRPWQDAAGRPTRRYERILEWHRERNGDASSLLVDPQQYASLRNKPDDGWLPWETRALVRASRAGDAEATRILTDSGLLPATAIGVTPEEWVQKARVVLEKGDSEGVRRYAGDAPRFWASARIYWLEGSPEWRRAARTIGSLGAALVRDSNRGGLPADTIASVLRIGLQGGHGPSFTALLDLGKGVTAADEADSRVVELSAQVLDVDIGNAAFLEAVALPRLKNRSRWSALFRSRLLYADDASTPTSLLEFSRASAAREVRRGILLEGGSVADSFFPRETLFRHGHTGRLLLAHAEQENDPLAIRALSTLGYARGDWHEILNP